jgi:hypothetical protein
MGDVKGKLKIFNAAPPGTSKDSVTKTSSRFVDADGFTLSGPTNLHRSNARRVLKFVALMDMHNPAMLAAMMAKLGLATPAADNFPVWSFAEVKMLVNKEKTLADFRDKIHAANPKAEYVLDKSQAEYFVKMDETLDKQSQDIIDLTIEATSTLNPQPSTLNPQPSTLNPQPSTLNPQPSTRIPPHHP